MIFYVTSSGHPMPMETATGYRAKALASVTCLQGSNMTYCDQSHYMAMSVPLLRHQTRVRSTPEGNCSEFFESILLHDSAAVFVRSFLPPNGSSP